MNLHSRVARLELKQGGGNPLEDLTDEELERAIAALDQQIAEALDVAPGDAAAQMKDARCDMSEEQLRALLTRIKGGDLA
jgi:hypothetical protein